MWYEKVLAILKDKDLRKRFLIVLFLFVIFRLVANIPIPGFSKGELRNFFLQNQTFGFLNIFTGGALSNFSIVLLGLGPYITATIILQLMTMIFPALERLYKEEGALGRQKFNQYARLLTVPLAALEGYGMLNLFIRQGLISQISIPLMILALLTITAGSIFLMWLGEIISEQGIGNGISLLIFAGIVARLPINIFETFVTFDVSKIPSYLLFFTLAIIIIAAVVLITEARRDIPISFAKMVRGRKMYGGGSTSLPLSINPAGVMPIIFALSILLFPTTILNYFGTYENMIGKIAKEMEIFLNNLWIHGILYFLLVVLFTYFYTAVTFDPKAISENLQKIGGFVEGIRPGRSTAIFIKNILNRVLLTGAIFLGLIAILPSIITGLTGIRNFNFLVGGTSVLIIVSVILDTVRQINAQLKMREYETF